MNIKIDKIGLAQTSAYLLIMSGIVMAGDNAMNRKIEGYKSSILENDSSKYKTVSEQVKNMPLQAQTIMWENALNEVQDSIKKAGEAHKNYFEGSMRINKGI